MRIILLILLGVGFWLNFSYAQEEKTHLSQIPYEEEIGYLQRALGIDPDNFGIYYSLGIAYYRQNQYDKVIECHQKFSQLTDYPQAYRNLEKAYRKIGDYSKAREYAQKASAYQESNPSVSLRSMARDNREIEILSKILLINPEVGALYANIKGLDAVKKEDLAKEIGYLQRALGIDPDNFGIYYGLGIAYYKAEDYDKVIEYCLKFTQANRGCAYTHYGLGIAYNNQGDSTNALAEVEQLKRMGYFDLAEKLEAIIRGATYQGNQEKEMQDLKRLIKKARELEGMLVNE